MNIEEYVQDRNGTAVALTRARINATADDDNTLVAATADKKIAVYALAITPTAAGQIDIQDADGSPVHASFDGADGGPIVLPFMGVPWIVTSEDNVALEMNNTASQDVLGVMLYALV